MTTFKHLNKYFCGMLVLACCLFGGIGMTEAIKTYDISLQCIPMSVSTGETITPNDICYAAGYGHCHDAGITVLFHNDENCTVGTTAPVVGNCDSSVAPVVDSKGVIATALVCNSKTWGVVPKPDNVPGDFNQSIKNTTDWILGFVGMIAVLMLIWGGINYLTSAGDEDKARTGKKTISYAIIGLVVAGIAYAIVDVIITVIL